MLVGIVDADLVAGVMERFPNLAAMKLSAYHKAQGHEAVQVRSWDALDGFDRVYVCKVFTKTPVGGGRAKLGHGGRAILGHFLLKNSAHHRRCQLLPVTFLTTTLPPYFSAC